jgi:hypothetical protein
MSIMYIIASIIISKYLERHVFYFINNNKLVDDSGTGLVGSVRPFWTAVEGTAQRAATKRPHRTALRSEVLAVAVAYV